MAETSNRPALHIEDLHVYYGESHALQGVSLTLPAGILSVVGRNGMGKTTLCNAITGLKPARSGQIRVAGRAVSGLEPHQIHRLGVGYVPQGRRVWPSLTVDEHLRLAAGRKADAVWTVDRVYQTFPRLAERRGNGGAQLSGGEQQMLAISRALLSDPKLLIMDEPTEGLAPVIVDQVAQMLRQLAAEGGMSILLIEQNIGVATSVSDQVAIMVNGRINRIMAASELAADRGLQQRLLGVGRHAEAEPAPQTSAATAAAAQQMAEVYRLARHQHGPFDQTSAQSSGQMSGQMSGQPGDYRPLTALPNRWNLPSSALRAPPTSAAAETKPQIFAMPLSQRAGRVVFVAGTYDTKGPELTFMAERIKALGLKVRRVDLSTSGKPVLADIPAREVAMYHPQGPGAVLTGDRGASVSAMAEAFAAFMAQQRDVGGVLSAGGSGGTSMATAGMRALPIGFPKVMVSTVASGEVGSYVGASDILMLHSVADVQGLNAITETVLSNAAHAIAGMVAAMPSGDELEAKRRMARPALGLSMFGVTTPLVQAVSRLLDSDYDCLVFHATGTGGRSMEALADSGLLRGVLDLTTTEVADLLVGGVFAASEDRFGAIIRTGLPYVGSVGALDMVNFAARSTVPEKFAARRFVLHNPQVTLMRTTAAEMRACGEWIVERLNRMTGPVRLLLPLQGVSALDAPGQPFHDPEADQALFDAITSRFRPGLGRELLPIAAHINDPVFAEAAAQAFRAISPKPRRSA